MTAKEKNGTSNKACIVCGGSLAPVRLPGLMQCRQCDFVTANVDLSDAELASLYGHDYFHGKEYLDYIAEADSLRVNFARRLSTLGSLTDLSKADLLEIGCAYGFFLQEAGKRTKRARGIDISSDAVSEAINRQKVDAQAGDYLAFDPGAKLDIITMWDTVEHLARPDLFVAKASKDLRDGGLLAITTGDIGSLNARLRGKSWRMIHPPTHLHYFSKATLSNLLERNGFEVVHSSNPGNSRKLRSVLYFIAALKLGRPGIYMMLHKLPIFDLNLTVNLFDIMFVVGRKRSSMRT